MATLNIPMERLIVAKMKIESGEDSVTGAAKALGISWSGLQAAFQRAGMVINRAPGVFNAVRVGVSQERLAEAKARIESGESSFKLEAAAMGMTENPLRKRFKRAGIIVRSPRNRGRPIGEKADYRDVYSGPWDVGLSNRMLRQSFFNACSEGL